MTRKAKIWRRQNVIMKKGDVCFTDAQPTDIVIVVMGPTGAGKSTFINTLFGEEVVKVGHDLKSCTSTLQHIIHPLGSGPTARRVVVVDTPGFDDTYVDDAEILRRISVWLATSYACNMKLAGVIYLHDISRNRLQGTMIKNLQVFRKLCGEDSLSSVVLATTKWSDLLDSTVGETRVLQLKSNFWKDMLDGGAEVFEFRETQESARTIANHLLRNHFIKEWDVLKLQQELVDFQKSIPETDAGMQLRYTLREFVKMSKDKASQEQLNKALAAIQSLKISIPQQLRVMIGLQTAFRPSEPAEVLVRYEKRSTETATFTENLLQPVPPTPITKTAVTVITESSTITHEHVLPALNPLSSIDEWEELLGTNKHTPQLLPPTKNEPPPAYQPVSIEVILADEPGPVMDEEKSKGEAVPGAELLNVPEDSGVRLKRMSKEIKTVETYSTRAGTFSHSHGFKMDGTAMVDVGNGANVSGE